MSDIVLSASVRQNLLSLQSTADLLSTTQNRLATGKKVNTALDNPTNYFTAASLDNRASDISNLLDGIGNGVQVLQAANTGITSLQKLVDSAKSVANQALQATVGYSTKSSISTTITGATADNLLGTTSADTPATAGTATAAANFATVDVSATGSLPTSASIDQGAYGTVDLSTTGTIAFTLNVDGTDHAISLDNTITALDKTQVTGSELAAAINAQAGSTVATFDGTKLTFASGTSGSTSSVTITGTSGTQASGAGIANHAIVNGDPAGADASLSFDVTVDGGSVHHVTISAADLATYNGDSANSANLITNAASALSGDDVAKLINYQVGSNVASFAANKLTFTSTTTGANSRVEVSTVTTAGGASNTTGITAALDNTGNALVPGTSALDGKTLHFDAIGNGSAVDITFGGSGVKTLNDLNAKLSANNLLATIDNSGKLTITTTNDAASKAIGAVTGTATDTGAAFNGVSGGTTAGTGGVPTQDAAALATRANLVAQYNNILDQITSTSQDSSFNGVNLLNGDQLKLTFNETGKSTLKIQGVTFNSAGLGLSALTAGTDFVDNESANNVIANLDKASSTLRTEASALGSNLSIVQIRQDFSKNLINVLQTGSSNLTLADTNEEAANSQALSTRQSIAVSALALANQSQQSVLQLLR